MQPNWIFSLCIGERRSDTASGVAQSSAESLTPPTAPLPIGLLHNQATGNNHPDLPGSLFTGGCTCSACSTRARLKACRGPSVEGWKSRSDLWRHCPPDASKPATRWRIVTTGQIVVREERCNFKATRSKDPFGAVILCCRGERWQLKRQRSLSDTFKIANY